jgi:WD40 repeat protein
MLLVLLAVVFFRPARPLAVLPHSGPVVCLGFSPDGTMLAAGSKGAPALSVGTWVGELKLWDLAPLDQRAALAQSQWANALAFAPDGKSLAVGLGRYNDMAPQNLLGYRTVPGVVRVYDPATARLKATLAHRHGVYTVAFSPDGKLLASGGGEWSADPENPGEAEVYLWDTSTWKKLTTLQGLRGRIMALAFSPDGKTLAVGDGFSPKAPPEARSPFHEPHGSVKLYAPGNPRPRKTLLVQEGNVRQLAFSAADGSLLVVTAESGSLALWNPETGQETMTAVPLHKPHADRAVACLGEDGKNLAVAASVARLSSIQTEIEVWDLTSAKRIFFRKEDRLQVHSLAISPDGTTLALGMQVEVQHASDLYQIQLWSLGR